MKIANKPFDILTFFVDLIICGATFLIGGTLSMIVSIAWTGSRVEGLGISAYVALPIVSTLFYFLRRQFNISKTLIEIVISTLVLYVCFQFIVDFDISFATIIGTPTLVLTITKHVADLFINKISRTTA